MQTFANTLTQQAAKSSPPSTITLDLCCTVSEAVAYAAHTKVTPALTVDLPPVLLHPSRLASGNFLYGSDAGPEDAAYVEGPWPWPADAAVLGGLVLEVADGVAQPVVILASEKTVFVVAKACKLAAAEAELFDRGGRPCALLELWLHEELEPHGALVKAATDIVAAGEIPEFVLTSKFHVVRNGAMPLLRLRAATSEEAGAVERAVRAALDGGLAVAGAPLRFSSSITVYTVLEAAGCAAAPAVAKAPAPAKPKAKGKAPAKAPATAPDKAPATAAVMEGGAVLSILAQLALRVTEVDYYGCDSYEEDAQITTVAATEGLSSDASWKPSKRAPIPSSKGRRVGSQEFEAAANVLRIVGASVRARHGEPLETLLMEASSTTGSFLVCRTGVGFTALTRGSTFTVDEDGAERLRMRQDVAVLTHDDEGWWLDKQPAFEQPEPAATHRTKRPRPEPGCAIDVAEARLDDLLARLDSR